MLKVMSLKSVTTNSSMYPEKSSAATVDNAIFKVSLDEDGAIHRDELLEKMDALLQDVEEIKGKIQEDLTMDNILEYKETIKSFLNFYVDSMLGYQDITLRHPKYGYSQRMTIVRNIEKEVNDLEDVMSLIDTKTGHLDVLNKIGEINGMILDLVL